MSANERAAAMVGRRVVVKRGKNALPTGTVAVVIVARVDARDRIWVTLNGTEVRAKSCDLY